MAHTLFLDTFALFKIAKSSTRMQAIRQHVLDQNFTVITSSTNVTEMFPNDQGWERVADFLASMPFCIAETVDKLTEREVRQYPGATTLGMEFCSTATKFTSGELRDAILTNLQGKIAGFHQPYRDIAQRTYDALQAARQTFMPPERSGRYSDLQRETFLQIGVLQALPPHQRAEMSAIVARGEAIDITRLKTVYVQQLAIWVEYYVQGKVGKVSDMGDFVVLGYAPYLDECILDKERVDLVRRINRMKMLEQPLQVHTLREFLAAAGTN